MFSDEYREQGRVEWSGWRSDIGGCHVKGFSEKVEGKCTGRYGYTILVARIQKTKKGRLDVVTGNAHFM
eukprot:1334228-Amorphochlora_amoeboformis.AAC.2